MEKAHRINTDTAGRRWSGGADCKRQLQGFRGAEQAASRAATWAFPAAWTLLYILMGIAAYLVYCSEKYPGRIERTLTFYAVQLFMNFCWTLIFFNLKLYLAAFIWLVLLWAAIAGTALLFRFISKPAGWLMLPYLAWVTFAGYLNLGVYILNR